MYTVILCNNHPTNTLWEHLHLCNDIFLRPAAQGCVLTGDIALYTHPYPLKKVQLHCRVGIAPGDASAALQFFKKQNIPLLTVGRAGQDTLTMSSRQETSAVLCLQREICTLNGDCVGPAEYPITFDHPYSDHTLLYVAAVLLLCGKENQLLQGRLF